MLESLSQLRNLMVSYGADRLYAKKLAPNDNSKNQVYLGSDFSSLNILPNQGVYNDTSNKGSKRDRFKANFSLFWVDEFGQYEAPNAQMVLYPKYPEVRMSGFLIGCAEAPSEVMAVSDIGAVFWT